MTVKSMITVKLVFVPMTQIPKKKNDDSDCEDEMTERDVRKDEPPKDFEMNNPVTKEIDYDAYWRATRKSIPCKTPCYVMKSSTTRKLHCLTLFSPVATMALKNTLDFGEVAQ